MNLKAIIEVCIVRAELESGCHNCKYYGSVCEHAKKVLRVHKPLEYKNNLFTKKGEPNNEGFSKEK